MFLNKKLSQNLKETLEDNKVRSYNVIIHCKNLIDVVEKKINSHKGKIKRIIPCCNIISAYISEKLLQRLIEMPMVSFIDFDGELNLCGKGILGSNGLAYSTSLPYTGKSVTIAVIDTGAYPHGDLLKPFNKLRGFKDLINEYNYPYDDHGHGTFIAGILSGSGHNSKGMYKGIAPDSSLYVVKAFNNQGVGYYSDILYGISHILDASSENNIKVLCLPFKMNCYNKFITSIFNKIFQLCKEKGIVVVVPAGNSGNTDNSIYGFGLLDTCITIGGSSSTVTNEPYNLSSGGYGGKKGKPNFIAPCTEIISLNSDCNYIPERNGVKLYPKKFDNYYKSFSGTSCSCSYVSGLCALLFEKNPNYSVDDVISILKLYAKALDLKGNLQGHGLIDTEAMLENNKGK